jgi:hypothetical protein
MKNKMALQSILFRKARFSVNYNYICFRKPNNDKIMISKRWILVTIIYLHSTLSFSQTLYVDSAIFPPGNGGSWSTAFASLGNALDSAHKNPAIDSILVAKGTYIPRDYPFGVNTGNINDLTFHIREGLEVYGGYSSGGTTRNIKSNPTILSGANSTDSFIHVVIMGGATLTDTSILDGFTIEKGFFRNGALIMPLMLGAFSVPRLTGGGVCVFGGANLIINCTIQNNRASDAGGGISSFNSSTIVKNNLIQYNSDYATYQGTGIFLSGGNSLISDNVIQYNEGTGISTMRTNISITRNLLKYNYGTAIDIIDSTSKVANNVITNNTGSLGGGLHTSAGVHYIVNNTFSKNDASFGGGFFADLGSVNYLSNNIFWGNKNGGGFIDSLYSDVYNKSATIIAKNNLFQTDSSLISTLPLAAGSQKNIYKVNPQFKGGTGMDSLSLLPTSLLIDKGDSTLFTLSDKIDYFFADRIQNDNIDIGAVETNSCISIVSLNDTICYGDSINFGGIQRKTPGVYIDTLLNINSCDSVVTLNLQVKLCFNDTNITTKACTPITLGQVLPNVAGTSISLSVSKGVINSNGTLVYTPNINFIGNDTVKRVICIAFPSGLVMCDTQLFIINVLPIDTSTFSKTICSGSTYNFNGNNLSVPGIYKDTLLAVNGCDSIVTLNLTVLPKANSTQTVSLCKGKTYLFNGIQRGVSGTYLDTFTAANGCDSIVTLNLTILSPTVIVFTDSSSFASAYSWRNKSYTTAGTYYDTSAASNKCDTIFKLVLTAKAPPSPAAAPLRVLYSGGALYASIDSATSYQWYLCGPPIKKITGANKRYFQVSDKSKYTVVVTKNGKTDTAACASNSSINSYTSFPAPHCFPNPVLNKLTIEFGTKHRDMTIDLMANDGRILWSKDYTEIETTTIDMKLVSQGIYYLHIRSLNGINNVIKVLKSDD